MLGNIEERNGGAEGQRPQRDMQVPRIRLPPSSIAPAKKNNLTKKININRSANFQLLLAGKIGKSFAFISILCDYISSR